MSDRRKHIRVEHRAQVEVVSANGNVSASSLDLSSSGMQIVVNIPESFDDIRRITFTLPHTSESISIPCRIVRSATTDDDAQLLALAFEYEAATQRMLVDNFVRDRMEASLQAGSAVSDARQIPRTDCRIDTAEMPGSDVEILSIDNISSEGLLLSFSRGSLEPGQRQTIHFYLPGDRRRLTVEGELVYLLRDEFDGPGSAGFRLVGLKEPTRARINNFVVSTAEKSSVRSVHSWLFRNGAAKEFEIASESEIRALFTRAAAYDTPIHTIVGESYEIHEVHLPVAPEPGRNAAVACSVPLEEGSASCSFAMDGHSYYFRSRIVRNAEGYELVLPVSVFRSDKRSSDRRIVERTVTLFHSGSGRQLASGRILDVSRSGFSCEVRGPASLKEEILPGTPVHYEVDERLALGSQGEIRHCTSVGTASGVSILRIGVEAGVARKSCTFLKIDDREWSSRQHTRNSLPRPIHHLEHRVGIPTLEGGRIAAILGATHWHRDATVVIIPPAFGKKKETLAPLFSVLLANFSASGRELVVIRYDGIDRPGESSKTVDGRPRGYEMLDYRISQGQSDMQAVLDYAYANPFFIPREVVLVTFSMSALDGRKLLREVRNQGRIHLWLSVMGVPAAQRTLVNIQGGTDILAHYRMGVPTGTSGVLGHLVNMDRLAEDLVSNGYAYLTDARYDMARISVPVVWMYGAYDKWVDAEEVRDIMNIASDGERFLLEIPTGHNLHTSDDAILAFKILTTELFRRLFADAREVVEPDREQMLRLIAYERERLNTTEMDDPDAYWRDYLIGRGGESQGYDFYRNIKEFRAFLVREAELLDAQPGERIADMGCGTGLFLEALLGALADAWADRSDQSLEIVAVDLIPEALEKARLKVEAMTRDRAALKSVTVEFRQRNLQPDRLIPIREFVNDGTIDLEMLRGRVSGLKHEMVDLFRKSPSPALRKLLSGAMPDGAMVAALRTSLGDGPFQVAAELNRAIRFVNGNLIAEDVRPDSDGRKGRHVPRLVGVADLRFERLVFSDAPGPARAAAEAHQPNFANGAFDRIMASLFISYLFLPDQVFEEFYRILAPGGTLVVSSMRPDSDISVIFTDFVDEVSTDLRASDDAQLPAARAMLNEAAALFELEEEGYFTFYTADELAEFLERSGFVDIRVEAALGDPPQAVIARGRKPA